MVLALVSAPVFWRPFAPRSYDTLLQHDVTPFVVVVVVVVVGVCVVVACFVLFHAFLLEERYAFVAVGRVGSTSEAISQRLVLVPPPGNKQAKLPLLVEALQGFLKKAVATAAAEAAEAAGGGGDERGNGTAGTMAGDGSAVLGRTMVFVQKKRSATWVRKALEKVTCAAAPDTHHAHTVPSSSVLYDWQPKISAAWSPKHWSSLSLSLPAAPAAPAAPPALIVVIVVAAAAAAAAAANLLLLLLIRTMGWWRRRSTATGASPSARPRSQSSGR